MYIYILRHCPNCGALLYMRPLLWGAKKMWGIYKCPTIFSGKKLHITLDLGVETLLYDWI